MTRDFSRAGKAARRKGANGELEVRNLLREHGWTSAHRSWRSGADGDGDVVEALPDTHIEVKRMESVCLAAWWKQASRDARPTDTVLIVHRGSQQPWQATGLLTELFPILQALPLAPIVCGRSFRPIFLAEVRKATQTRRPCVIHPLGDEAMVTVLFEDLLGELARRRRATRPFCLCSLEDTNPDCVLHGERKAA